MPNRLHQTSERWRWFVPLLPLITMTSCIFIVSTSPTSTSGATIVFIAVDDRGAAVPSLQVSILDVVGNWRIEGVTTPEGSFHCNVRSDVTRVRAEIVPPSGYALAASEGWPRHLDLFGGTTLRVEIRLRRR